MIEKYELPREEWERLIDSWIFSERDRNLLKRRLLDGIKYEDLAEEFEMSVRQVKAVIYKQSDKLFRHIS